MTEEEPTQVEPTAPAQSNAPAAGWYPDVHNAGWRRYWDGTAWTDRREPDPAAASQAPPVNTPTYCRACGKEVDPRAVVCPSCGVSQQQAPVAFPSANPPGMRTGGIAILLSIIWPGAGHLYADDNSTAIVFMIVSGINFLLSFTFFWLIIGIPLWLGTAIWCSIDSNRKVEAWNRARGFPAS